MYKLTSNPNIVIRLSDGASISGPSDSQDWLTYQAWLDAGNTPEPAITLTQAKQMKVDDLTNICGDVILGGFTSSALGIAHWYDSEIEDQINIIGATIAAGGGASIPYKCTPDGQEKTWKDHTPSQMQAVFSDGVIYKTTQLMKLTNLKAQVEAATSIEEVNNINW